MSFRLRTAAVVLAVTAFTMGAAFFLVWDRFVASQRAQLDEALLAVAHREASEAAAGQIEFTDAPGPSANAVGPLPKYGVLYDDAGRVLAQTPNFATVPTAPVSVALERCFDFEHDGLAMRGVVVAAPGTGMRVLLASPREDLEDDARILARAMALAFAVGSVWAAVVAFAVAARLTENHRQLGNVARRVASGDLSARVSLRGNARDLQQMSADLNHMIDRLVGLVAAQDRFVAHAAHELRTPLTALRVELEHALRTAKDPAEYAAAMQGALDSARELSALAEDLLALARARRPREDPGTTAVADMAGDAVSAVLPIASARAVRVELEPTTLEVAAERRAATRILRNLLENAARFAPAGGHVRVWTQAEGDRAKITVGDDGPGVPAHELESVFEAFARRRQAEDEGTGLGLSIARSLARSYGGDVVAEPGPGGRFVVTLPLAPPASARSEPPSSSRARTSSDSPPRETAPCRSS